MYELEGLRDELDALAVSIATGFKIKLDHSPKSVKKVEEILGMVHKEYKKTRNDEGLNGVHVG